LRLQSGSSRLSRASISWSEYVRSFLDSVMSLA
jgi:hypothetical protein